jgi:hypothetical protein
LAGDARLVKREALVDAPVAVLVGAIAALARLRAAGEAAVEHALVREPIAVVVCVVADLGLADARADAGAPHAVRVADLLPRDAGARVSSAGARLAFDTASREAVVDEAVAVIVELVAHFSGRRAGQGVALHAAAVLGAGEAAALRARTHTRRTRGAECAKVLIYAPVAVIVGRIAVLRCAGVDGATGVVAICVAPTHPVAVCVRRVAPDGARITPVALSVGVCVELVGIPYEDAVVHGVGHAVVVLVDGECPIGDERRVDERAIRRLRVEVGGV